MKRILDRWDRRFIDRVFTDHEISYCWARKQPDPHFTVRFAAKEAVMKALSATKVQAISFKDIEVYRSGNGRPVIKLHGRACEAANLLGVRRILVSLTHSADIAAAQVVLEGEGVNSEMKPC